MVKEQIKYKPQMVQKSNALLSLSESSFSLMTLKILDLYLEKINIRNEDNRLFSFDKVDIEEKLGISKINLSELEHCLNSLLQPVTIKDKNSENGQTEVVLFDVAESYVDSNYGLRVIRLRCSEQAKPYFFNIDSKGKGNGKGYLSYQIGEISKLKSRYSYVLYLYLKKNSFRSHWTIELPQLRQMMSCTAKSYDEFKVFNQTVLKKSHSEIISGTDLAFCYTPQKRGRTVVGVEFKVSQKRKSKRKASNTTRTAVPPTIPVAVPVSTASTAAGSSNILVGIPILPNSAVTNTPTIIVGNPTPINSDVDNSAITNFNDDMAVDNGYEESDYPESIIGIEEDEIYAYSEYDEQFLIDNDMTTSSDK